MSEKEEEFVEPQQYVKRDPVAFEAAVDEIRKKAAKKMDKWANTLIFSKYIPPTFNRKEGERWKDANGKEWEMKDGVARSITNLQDARMPHWCPRCSVSMTHRFDRKFYFLRGWCFNCNIEIEGQMRLDGTYEAFERRSVIENEKAFLKDKIEEMLCYIKDFKEPQIHFEDGRWEKLADKSYFKELFESLLADVEILEKRLEFLMSINLDELTNEPISKTTSD